RIFAGLLRTYLNIRQGHLRLSSPGGEDKGEGEPPCWRSVTSITIRGGDAQYIKNGFRSSAHFFSSATSFLSKSSGFADVLSTHPRRNELPLSKSMARRVFSYSYSRWCQISYFGYSSRMAFNSSAHRR